MISLRSITRFPIKGLNGLAMDKAELLLGEGIAGDRRYAMTVNDDADGGVWKTSRSFLINAVNDNLLKFNGQLNGQQYTLVSPDGAEFFVDFDDEASVDTFNRLLPQVLASVVDPALSPRLVKRRGDEEPAAYWDYPDSQISVINIETVQAISSAFGEQLDIRRFRGNLMISGLPAWDELGFAGSRYELGDAQIEFTRPARRCAAISVNPDTGERDVEAHKLLAQKYGHGYLGIYTHVVKAGEVRCGDQLRMLGPAKSRPTDALTEGASPYVLWPKLAGVESVAVVEAGLELALASSGPWPLIDNASGKAMKLHLGSDETLSADIVSINESKVVVFVPTGPTIAHSELKVGKKIVVSGPYGLRK